MASRKAPSANAPPRLPWVQAGCGKAMSFSTRHPGTDSLVHSQSLCYGEPVYPVPSCHRSEHYLTRGRGQGPRRPSSNKAWGCTLNAIISCEEKKTVNYRRYSWKVWTVRKYQSNVAASEKTRGNVLSLDILCHFKVEARAGTGALAWE